MYFVAFTVLFIMILDHNLTPLSTTLPDLLLWGSPPSWNSELPYTRPRSSRTDLTVLQPTNWLLITRKVHCNKLLLVEVN